MKAIKGYKERHKKKRFHFSLTQSYGKRQGTKEFIFLNKEDEVKLQNRFLIE